MPPVHVPSQQDVLSSQCLPLSAHPAHWPPLQALQQRLLHCTVTPHAGGCPSPPVSLEPESTLESALAASASLASMAPLAPSTPPLPASSTWSPPSARSEGAKSEQPPKQDAMSIQPKI
jgi:hypothetical protein